LVRPTGELWITPKGARPGRATWGRPTVRPGELQTKRTPRGGGAAGGKSLDRSGRFGPAAAVGYVRSRRSVSRVALRHIFRGNQVQSYLNPTVEFFDRASVPLERACRKVFSRTICKGVALC